MQRHDVHADGNCFYTALSICVNSDPDLRKGFHMVDATLQECVAKWRLVVSTVLRRKGWGRQWFDNLLKILQNDVDLVHDYPFISHAYRSLDLDRDVNRDGFVDACVDAILCDGVWVSEFEVSIISRVLELKGVDIFVVEGANHIDDFEAERQLHFMLDNTPCPRCIILVRSDDSHYSYFTLNYEAVMEVADVSDHIKGQIEISAEEEHEMVSEAAEVPDYSMAFKFLDL